MPYPFELILFSKCQCVHGQKVPIFWYVWSIVAGHRCTLTVPLVCHHESPEERLSVSENPIHLRRWNLVSFVIECSIFCRHSLPAVFRVSQPRRSSGEDSGASPPGPQIPQPRVHLRQTPPPLSFRRFSPLRNKSDNRSITPACKLEPGVWMRVGGEPTWG
jgi:hypothetical protein